MNRTVKVYAKEIEKRMAQTEWFPVMVAQNKDDRGITYLTLWKDEDILFWELSYDWTNSCDVVTPDPQGFIEF
jgi:hypothetical protein